MTTTSALLTIAALLMAIAAVMAEALHRRRRSGLPVAPIAGVTVLRVALVAVSMALPAILLFVLTAAGL